MVGLHPVKSTNAFIAQQDSAQVVVNSKIISEVNCFLSNPFFLSHAQVAKLEVSLASLYLNRGLGRDSAKKPVRGHVVRTSPQP